MASNHSIQPAITTAEASAAPDLARAKTAPTSIRPSGWTNSCERAANEPRNQQLLGWIRGLPSGRLVLAGRLAEPGRLAIARGLTVPRRLAIARGLTVPRRLAIARGLSVPGRLPVPGRLAKTRRRTLEGACLQPRPSRGPIAEELDDHENRQDERVEKDNDVSAPEEGQKVEPIEREARSQNGIPHSSRLSLPALDARND